SYHFGLMNLAFRGLHLNVGGCGLSAQGDHVTVGQNVAFLVEDYSGPGTFVLVPAYRKSYDGRRGSCRSFSGWSDVLTTVELWGILDAFTARCAGRACVVHGDSTGSSTEYTG